MVVIKSLIENLLLEELGDYFRGFLGEIKLKFFIKRLKDEVEISILKQYGDRIYYLDFDRFLIEQNVLAKIIQNFLNQDTLQSKTINQFLCIVVSSQILYSREILVEIPH